MSTVTTRGKQMLPVLNTMGTECACCGNHDSNPGVDALLRLPVAHLQRRRRAHDAEGGRLADGLRAHVVEVPGGGGGGDTAGEGAAAAAAGAPLRVGLAGLVESECLAALATLDAADVVYEDFVVCA